ncbi:septum formation initiator family protein [Acidimicrobiaceae bacterium]|nr:septum formation initiator family protein [Acidimicrobiaceae bacterium]|tara:strand:- start:134 stop:511 length:378 start_codon:yes stop_codon:yes gene_type:complete
MLRQNLFSKVIFLITSFIFVFFIFDTWELSFKDYQSLESQLESRIQKADELKNEINFIQEKIDDLEDPEKLDIILRQHGYGLPGENIYRFKVPEPVTPLEETLQRERSKGLLEFVVEFIVGTNSD